MSMNLTDSNFESIFNGFGVPEVPENSLEQNVNEAQDLSTSNDQDQDLQRLAGPVHYEYSNANENHELSYSGQLG